VSLTRIIVTQVFPFATILFALGSQIGFYRTIITGFENQAENLFACPECYRLRETKGQELGLQSLRYNYSKTASKNLTVKSFSIQNYNCRIAAFLRIWKCYALL